jgi:hypothetical protein
VVEDDCGLGCFSSGFGDLDRRFRRDYCHHYGPDDGDSKYL